MNKDNYTEINSKTIDAWVENGVPWSAPVTHKVYTAATRGKWTIADIPNEWFPLLKGVNLLGLASGGGQQMPIFAALGAKCTLLDYSERQLAQDRFVAEREGYEIELVKADMTQRFTFGDEHFDVIFHPWSNNYVEDVYHIWRECYRVLRRGGVLIAQMSNGLYFLFDDIQNEPLTLKYKLPWNPLKMPQEKFRQMAENLEGLEFSHTLDENIGGQLKAGFTLTNIEERRDPPGSCVLREYTSQSYVTRAVKL